MHFYILFSLFALCEMYYVKVQRTATIDSVLLISEKRCRTYSTTAKWIRTDNNDGNCFCGEKETFGPLDGNGKFGCFKGTGSHLGCTLKFQDSPTSIKSFLITGTGMKAKLARPWFKGCTAGLKVLVWHKDGWNDTKFTAKPSKLHVAISWLNTINKVTNQPEEVKGHLFKIVATGCQKCLLFKGEGVSNLNILPPIPPSTSVVPPTFTSAITVTSKEVTNENSSSSVAIGLGVSCSILVVLAILVGLFLYRRRTKSKATANISRNNSKQLNEDGKQGYYDNLYEQVAKPGHLNPGYDEIYLDPIDINNKNFPSRPKESPYTSVQHRGETFTRCPDGEYQGLQGNIGSKRTQAEKYSNLVFEESTYCMPQETLPRKTGAFDSSEYNMPEESNKGKLVPTISNYNRPEKASPVIEYQDKKVLTLESEYTMPEEEPGYNYNKPDKALPTLIENEKPVAFSENEYSMPEEEEKDYFMPAEKLLATKNHRYSIEEEYDVPEETLKRNSTIVINSSEDIYCVPEEIVQDEYSIPDDFTGSPVNNSISDYSYCTAERRNQILIGRKNVYTETLQKASKPFYFETLSRT